MNYRSVFVVLVGIVLTACADDIDTLWSRLRASYLTASSSGAAGHLSTLRTDGSWADIDYADQSATAWKPLAHLQRAKAMSIAYSTQGNADYRSPAMRSGIDRALGYWYTRKPTSTNWWQIDIGQQLELGPILVILKNDLDSARIAPGCTYLKNPSKGAAIRPDFAYIRNEPVAFFDGMRPEERANRGRGSGNLSTEEQRCG